MTYLRWNTVYTSVKTILENALDVPVFDKWEGEADNYDAFVILGTDGSDQNEDASFQQDQELMTIEGGRNVNGTGIGAIIISTGDSDPATIRTTAATYAESIEDALRSSDTGGGAVDFLGVSNWTVFQDRNEAGSWVRVVFTFVWQEFA